MMYCKQFISLWFTSAVTEFYMLPFSTEENGTEQLWVSSDRKDT